MVDNNNKNISQGQNMSDTIKNWLMVALILIFVFLYAAALFGWIKTPADAVMLRVEPIIFIIIGYYLGRFPARQNEQTLKDEISRQTQKSDAAQYARAQAQQEREILEEKLKNVKVVLTSSPQFSYESLSEKKLSAEAIRSSGGSRQQNSVIASAIHILNS